MPSFYMQVSGEKSESVTIHGIAKGEKNAEYLAKLHESMAQLERGETISFSMEELRAMEADDWKPTPKVLEWMQRTGYKHE